MSFCRTKIRDPLASQDVEVDFSIQIALEADLASHTAFKCWHEANLVSIETELGLQVAFFVSSETCFRTMARGDLATKIFLCLRTLMGLEPLSERIYSNLSWLNWMTSVLVVDPRVSSSYCGSIFLLLKKIFPSRVAILFFIDKKCEKILQNSKRFTSKNEKNTSISS